MEKIIKISMPEAARAKYDRKRIIDQSPGGMGIWNGFRFEINNDCRECDYWIVYESPLHRESAFVKTGICLFLPSEVEHKVYPAGFLVQFNGIITSRTDMDPDKVIRAHYVNGWFVNKSYDELSAMNHVPKTKDLSIIVSDKVAREGHRERYAFVNKIIGHFKDKVDVFGRGTRFIRDKYEGLADYKYSVAIENSTLPGYWTEKIADCYLSHTMPVYYGCPDIEDYFSADSMISIDIRDFTGSIRKMEQAIEENLYEKHLDAILKGKDDVLNKYQFFPFLADILENRIADGIKSEKGKNITIGTQSPYLMKTDFKIKVKEALDAGKKYLGHRLFGKGDDFRLGS